MSTFKTVSASLAVSALVVTSASALTESEVSSIKQAVSNVPAPELAAKAADLVGSASEKEVVAVEVTRAAVSHNPAAAASVVGSVAKVAPEVAPAAAAVAAQLAPDQAEKIAKSAAMAAPDQAAKIAAAVAKTNPRHAARIARSVMNAFPKSATQIAEAVASAVPTAKTAVDSYSAIFASTPVGGGTVTTSDKRIDGTDFPSGQPGSAGEATPGYDYNRP